MRILVVSSTALEVEPLVGRLRRVSDTGMRSVSYAFRKHEIDVLTTGVGMVATAAWCSRAFAAEHYDLALNLGVCGSLDHSMPPPSVVHVTADRIAELGAEDGDEFLTIQQLGLLGENEFPFERGMLVNGSPPPLASLTALRRATGITVNTVHGNERTIAAVRERFRPQVETMEGAAFMYASLIAGVPFAQVRAVSNAVERRNRGAWKIDEAVQALGEQSVRLMESA
jgi:futalosine hydrolase